ncbi:MAG: CreA family protein [Parvularculaceae bacterium]|nr:CreA family protein [Parvularculaceae bacterium]
MRHLVLTAFSILAAGACARGGEHEEVGEFKNDLIGNEIKLEALKDPKVAGVTCHLSYFDRGFWDRAAKGDWFENPSNSSIACRQTGPISIGEINLAKSGEEVFSQQQSLIFKQLAVRRIYDAPNNTLIYVAYSRKPIEGSAKMAVSTISLYGQEIMRPADK